jgi:hypothetical protein
MSDLMKTVDTWFLVVCVILLGGYFLWSVRNLFSDLKESIQELKETIQKLYDLRNDHEGRIKVLETRMAVCEACNGHNHPHRRITDEDD